VPDLSVIVPMFDAESFVPACLTTIDRSRVEGVQFVLVDDCSTDRTGEMLDAAARTRPYLTVMHNTENIGVAASRNRAFETIDSRYVGYLDADDWCERDHFARLLQLVREHDVDFARIGHVRADGFKRSIEPVPGAAIGTVQPAQAGIGVARQRSAVDYPYLWAGIYDRTRIPAELFRFDEELRTAADRPWFWRLYMHAGPMVVGDQLSYFYRKDESTTALTQAGNANTLHFIRAYELVRDAVVPTGRDDWIEKAAAAAISITLFHIGRRARLSPALQERLFRESAAMLRSYPREHLNRAARGLSRATRLLLLDRLLRVEA
jgi:glycosyltransferase involved in cell wall biosynthesis